MKTRMGGMFLIAIMLCSVPGVAQLLDKAPDAPNVTFMRDPHTYGTQDETSYTIHAVDFLPAGNSSITWTGTYNRYSTSGGELDSKVFLPAGAAVIGYEVEACDSSNTTEFIAALGSCLTPAGACGPAGPIIMSGIANDTGCGFFRVNLSSPLTVDNVANTYLFGFSNGLDFTGALNLRAARVYYKLQVSTPPATPTFADVPTSHLFYQYIEALAASGITAGCTAPPNPNYCPDATLTRGQMAVFLARALGLHWAP